MTVSDLIKELRELPQDLPVIANLKEITDVDYNDGCYFIDKYSSNGYTSGPAVVLEWYYDSQRT